MGPRDSERTVAARSLGSEVIFCECGGLVCYCHSWPVIRRASGETLKRFYDQLRGFPFLVNHKGHEALIPKKSLEKTFFFCFWLLKSNTCRILKSWEMRNIIRKNINISRNAVKQRNPFLKHLGVFWGIWIAQEIEKGFASILTWFSLHDVCDFEACPFPLNATGPAGVNAPQWKPSRGWACPGRRNSHTVYRTHPGGASLLQDAPDHRQAQRQHVNLQKYFPNIILPIFSKMFAFISHGWN